MEMVVIALIFGVVCALIASSKGRSAFGWLILGTLFSLIALIVLALLPSLKISDHQPNPKTHVKCPDCKELVLCEASVCKHCGCKLIPQPAS